jgi:hypothetical protein
VPFKKKDKSDDSGSSVAVVDAVPPNSGTGRDGPNSAAYSNGGSPGGATKVAETYGHVGEKIATPFKGRLGDLLIEGNLINNEQLEAALARQAETGGKLGEVLVSMGALDARALADALAAVLGLEVLNLRRENVDPAALALLPEKVARTQLAIPVRFEGEYLQIAVA